MTPDDYMSPRPNKPLSRARLALEATHWAAIVFAFMLAILSLTWAMEITASDRPQYAASMEQIDLGSAATL